MEKENVREIVAEFIEEIWNGGRFERIDEFVDSCLVDHTLAPSFGSGREGLVDWIRETGTSFEHETTIEEQVCEKDISMVRLTMRMKHIGTWRGIEPAGREVSAKGYRCFRVRDGRIVEAWGLIDGAALEKGLRG